MGLGFLYSLFFIAAAFGGKKIELTVPQLAADVVVGLFYALLLKFRNYGIVRFAPVISSMALLLSLLGLKGPTFTPAGVLLTIHIALSLFSFSLLLLSGIASLFRYLSERKLKKGSLSVPLGIPITAWVKIERRLFFFGFIILTFDLVSAFVWLQLLVKKFVLDTRICSTLLLWLYYGAIFHLERFGVEPFRKKFHIFNMLGAVLTLLVLTFTFHSV